MKSYAYDLLMDNKRLDERELEEYRNIEIKKGIIKNAAGSALVKFGRSKVLVGVKFDLGTPYSDSPNEGTLMVNSEFTPLASPEFEPGRPGEDAIELSRVVDRGIRESHCIDLEKLCITPGEKIWTIFVDIHIINHDGNLIDCAFLGSIAALMDAKIPKTDEENENVLRDEFQGNLELLHLPTEVTVCKINDKTVLDPTVEEEGVIDCKLTVAVREDDKICALQKQGMRELTIDEIKEMIEISIEKSKELRKHLK